MATRRSTLYTSVCMCRFILLGIFFLHARTHKHTRYDTYALNYSLSCEAFVKVLGYFVYYIYIIHMHLCIYISALSTLNQKHRRGIYIILLKYSTRTYAAQGPVFEHSFFFSSIRSYRLNSTYYVPFCILDPVASRLPTSTTSVLQILRSFVLKFIMITDHSPNSDETKEATSLKQDSPVAACKSVRSISQNVKNDIQIDVLQLCM